MAELHRVEINERAPQEIDPESEEAVDAVSEEQTTETQEDRPGWLPEKFKSPEDMANAYSELEKKMGAGAEVKNNNQKRSKAMNNKRTIQQKIRILILLLLKLVKSSLRMTVLYLKRPIRILLRLGYQKS